MLFKSKSYERNELFLPGRMAYVVDLDDEYADTDIPTTLIRSKADCPTMEVSNQVLRARHRIFKSAWPLSCSLSTVSSCSVLFLFLKIPSVSVECNVLV
jgi:hypothetical protein